MTSEEFLRVFEKHLLVGEPKRSEILVELHNHFTEDAQALLGNPTKLAREENRLNLGLLHSQTRLFLVPVIVVGLGALIQMMDVYIGKTSSLSSRLLPEWLDSILFFYVRFVLPISFALSVGWTVARMHTPARLFARVMVFTFIIGALAGIPVDYYTGLQDLDIPDTLGRVIASSFMISALITGFFSAFAFAGVFMSSHSPSRKVYRLHQHYRFQLAIALISAIIFTALLINVYSIVGIKPLIVVHAPGIAIIAWLLWYSYCKIQNIRHLDLQSE